MNQSSVDVKVVAEQRVKTWFRTFVTWAVAHYVFGAVAIVASGVAAFSAADPETRQIASIMALLSTAFLTFFQPADNFQRFRRAWHLLDQARIQDATKPSYLDGLREAIRIGQEHINEGTLRPPVPLSGPSSDS